MAERLLHSEDSDNERMQSEEIDAVHELETPNVIVENYNNNNFDFGARKSSQVIKRAESENDIELL